MPLDQVATVGGAVVLVTILLQAIKMLLDLSPELVKRVWPTLAVFVGLLVTVPASLYIGADIGQAVVNGILAGGAAMGAYDVTSSLLVKPTPPAV